MKTEMNFKAIGHIPIKVYVFNLPDVEHLLQVVCNIVDNLLDREDQL